MNQRKNHVVMIACMDVYLLIYWKCAKKQETFKYVTWRAPIHHEVERVGNDKIAHMFNDYSQTSSSPFYVHGENLNIQGFVFSLHKRLRFSCTNWIKSTRNTSDIMIKGIPPKPKGNDRENICRKKYVREHNLFLHQYTIYNGV